MDEQIKENMMYAYNVYNAVSVMKKTEILVIHDNMDEASGHDTS